MCHTLWAGTDFANHTLASSTECRHLLCRTYEPCYTELREELIMTSELERMRLVAAGVEDQMVRIRNGRTRLIRDTTAIGAPSLRLTLREDSSVETWQTDGTYLDFNPEYTAKFRLAELEGLMAHETVHCLAGHPFRMGGRDPEIYGDAADVVTQGILHGTRREDGTAMFHLPPNKMDNRIDDFAGLSVETVYAKLKKEKQENGGSYAKPPTPNAVPYPSIVPPPPGSMSEDDKEASGQERLTPGDWKIIGMQAAMVNRKRGTMPAGLELEINNNARSRVDWVEKMRRFVEQCFPKGLSWSTPNRRFVSMREPWCPNGLYLPGPYKENMPRLAILWDTSGSMAGDQEMIASEVTRIALDTQPEAVDVVYCDAEVHLIETFRPDEPIEFHPEGGGGTAMQPGFDWIKQEQNNGVTYAAILCFTDLEIDNPTEPNIPTMWITPESVTQDGPFGETVRVPA